MKHNIGTVNALLRITGGLTLLAWSTANMAWEKPSGKQIFWSMVGAMKVAEGMTRYCPMIDMLGLEQKRY
ncbi:DUF2892 domain-containing protein [Sporosarcina sp. 179-K 3D1 HS]|uniref:YgaP family membrane protein n=1 Tax=Sporosarcina sp. 179-K 3D1 HS TaxID=3232169 RepID=UPI00399F7358